MEAVKTNFKQKPIQSADKCIGTSSNGIHTQQNPPTCFKALQMIEQQLSQQQRFKTTYQSEFGRSKFEVQRPQTAREAIVPLSTLSNKPQATFHGQSRGKREATQHELSRSKFEVQRPQNPLVCETEPKPLNESNKRPESQPSKQKDAIHQGSGLRHQDPCGVFDLVKLLFRYCLKIKIAKR